MPFIDFDYTGIAFYNIPIKMLGVFLLNNVYCIMHIVYPGAIVCLVRHVNHLIYGSMV